MLWVHYVGATIGLIVFIGSVSAVRRFRTWMAYEQMRKEYGHLWGRSEDDHTLKLPWKIGRAVFTVLLMVIGILILQIAKDADEPIPSMAVVEPQR